MPRITDALARLMPRWPMTHAPSRVEEKASRTGALIAFDNLGRPVWTPRDYQAFAREGFMQNAVVYRCVRMIAEAAASVPLLLYEEGHEHERHPLLDLIARPNPTHTGHDFLESWYGFLLVAGNAYAEVVSAGGELRELHVLRPDRMKVVPGPEGWPEGYEYTAGGQTVRFDGEAVPGVRSILHMRLFHPVNDYYGMSPIEAAATAIDIHNAASNWNKALLDNSARPSGALIYGNAESRMTPEQFDRLKSELEQGFVGSKHAGRPLLLEGGLDWRPLSLSPKDMDFIEAKNSAAREIALALGVPPMLLGIPGDNTYSNYQEAQRAFWRQTVLPLVNRTARALSSWLAPSYAPGGRLSGGESPGASERGRPLGAIASGDGNVADGVFEFRPDLDQVEALSSEREALWARLERTTFLTANEKRVAVGYPELEPAPETSPPVMAAKYSPTQPRVSQGNSDGGQWTDGGGGSGSSSGSDLSDDNSSEGNSQPIQVAGRGDALKTLLGMFRGSKPAKIPEFLSKRPGTGKITGKLDELTVDERRFAEEMRDLGNEIELIPGGTGRTPDFKINGKLHELKTISGVQRADSDGISSAISNRVLNARGQAADVIIDARQQAGMTKEIAERGISRALGSDTKKGIESITILTTEGPVYSLRNP